MNKIEIDKHFINWFVAKNEENKIYKVQKNINLKEKEIKYFKEDSDELKEYEYFKGMSLIARDIFLCDYFTEAKEIIDFAIVNNSEAVSLKGIMYDHQKFFNDNGKELLFNQIEKYLAHSISNMQNYFDRILSVEQTAEFFGINKQTFTEQYVDTGRILPFKITRGNQKGYNARLGFKLSSVQNFIKNM